VKRNVVLVAGGIAALVSAGLLIRILSIGKPEVIVILLPAMVGSFLALWRPDHRGFVASAAGLIALTAVVSLIGWVGLLYLPSVVLLLWCVASSRTSRAAAAGAS
jgi:hypothetical protein